MVNADVVLSITLLKTLTLQFCMDDIHMCLNVFCEKLCHILPSVSGEKKKHACRSLSCHIKRMSVLNYTRTENNSRYHHDTLFFMSNCKVNINININIKSKYKLNLQRI